MSRLDAFVQRVSAQRALLNEAINVLAEIEGIIFEIGLGNGRTFDHLREIFPDREIYVFDKKARAHASSTPDKRWLIEGQFADTLPAAVSQFQGRVALVHSDIGSQSEEHRRRNSELLNQVIAPALVPGGLLLSDLRLSIENFDTHPMPQGIGDDWYHAYRKPK